MTVDKNLFLHDLAVVAIMKNEAPYIREWLDYHMLAGVDHFYLYDNDSNDNTREILQPYIDAGVVTYEFYPGKAKQMEAYYDALSKYAFHCRYMSFIDGDEFIFPLNGGTITETADEFFAVHPNVAGIDINWHAFGSNYQETADYSRGVLDRFTRRSKVDHSCTKIIANPRKIDYICTPHYAFYFDHFFSINKNLIGVFPSLANVTDKIVVNHYYWKSREEYANKVNRGTATITKNHYSVDNFRHIENDVFDDRIIKYRDARRDAISSAGGGQYSRNFSSEQSN